MAKLNTNQIYLAAAGILAAVAVFFAIRTTVTLAVDPGSYQAVFLTNDQVFFGHISSQGGGYVTLTDVYYLRDKAPLVDPALAASDISLVKLGRELHAPTDKMRIAKDQILYVQELASNSRIIAAIQQSGGR